VLDLFCTAGRHDQIKSAIEQRFADVCDTVAVGGLPPDLLQDLAAIKTPFTGFVT
ncbi:MAG: hypothetical protein JSS20_13455, partial [Proteobacteria bacterium]|nr:hypothetical protein [Pseudomonadota bacterium]